MTNQYITNLVRSFKKQKGGLSVAAVQGLYVEIDFKFKNESLLKGINEAKKALKNLGVDFQNVQKNIQKSGYRAGEVFKKINKDDMFKVNPDAVLYKKEEDYLKKLKGFEDKLK